MFSIWRKWQWVSQEPFIKAIFTSGHPFWLICNKNDTRSVDRKSQDSGRLADSTKTMAQLLNKNSQTSNRQQNASCIHFGQHRPNVSFNCSPKVEIIRYLVFDAVQFLSILLNIVLSNVANRMQEHRLTEDAN